MATFACPFCKVETEIGAQRLNFCPACGQNFSGLKPGIDIRRVAIRQRQLLLAILLQIALYMSGLVIPASAPLALRPYIGIALSCAFLGTLIMNLVFTLGMLAALGYGIVHRVIYAVLLLAPCLSLLALLSANHYATQALQRVGLKVGLLGVSNTNLEKFLSITACHQCGYSLAGNTSGRCPECGAASINQPVTM